MAADRTLESYAWLSAGAAVATIILKTLAWYVTGSVGLLSDALESLINLAAALLALSMLRLAAAPPDEMHPYGRYKAEYFASGIEGALIVIAAASIVYAAAPRLFAPQPLEAPGLANLPEDSKITPPDFPEEIPCNVCTKEIAIKNIWRKHENNGSWQQLERDIFANKYMGDDKSSFLILEEQTGLIGSNTHLNKRFVKEEIFNEESLKKLGFGIMDGKLTSKYSSDDARKLLSDISNQVKNQAISTRKNRGKIIDVLEPSSQELIDLNKDKSLQPFDLIYKSSIAEDNNKKPMQTKRTKSKGQELFGGKLYLKIGEVSDLYRDVTDLYTFYLANQNHLSQSFSSLIRMSLRLLWETTSNSLQQKTGEYISANFTNAKQQLNQDEKTTLSNHNVTDKSIIQLLQTGAHNYQASSNIDQTIAISIILGAMLTISHGQDSAR